MTGTAGKHTPTPYELHTPSSGPEIHPQGDEDGLIVLADIDPEKLQTAEEREATAMFIVRACNLHDEMVGFLESLLDVDTSPLAYDNQRNERLRFAALDKVRALLAKAKEK